MPKLGIQEKIMPTHAILITYKDMETKVLPEFITKARDKYGDRFTQLYFDSAVLKGKLYVAIKAIPDGDRLKILSLVTAVRASNTLPMTRKFGSRRSVIL